MTDIMKQTGWTTAGILGAMVVVALAVTSRGKAATKTVSPPPPTVTIVRIEGEDVATYREYPARTYARDLVEVRGRVDGYLDQRTFAIGSDVRAGQVLYVLDVRPYEAEVERARGALAQSVADIAQAELPLFEHSGTSLPIELVSSEGGAPLRGRIENTLNAVNTKTGTLEVQATFHNVDHAVLPGQFVRVRVRVGARSKAVLVPQRAIQDVQGQQSVLTVDPDNIVRARAVLTGDRVDQRVVVEQGLRSGDAVIVDGLQKV